MPQSVFPGNDTYAIQSDAHQNAILAHIPLKTKDINSTDPELWEYKTCEYMDGNKCSSYVYSESEMISSAVIEVCRLYVAEDGRKSLLLTKRVLHQ